MFFWPAQFVKTLETRCWYRPTLLVTTFYCGKSLIISLPVRAKPNQEMRSTFFLCQKKDKMADGHPWRLCVSHSPFKGSDFCEERTGNFRASGKQIWKSVWNEHKIIAWSYWPYIYVELLFRAKKRGAKGAWLREVYNLVTRKARVPCVVLTTSKVGRPIYTCIYLYISRWCPPWRHLVCDVPEHLVFPCRQHQRVCCIDLFFLRAVLGVGKYFLQWISNAKVLLRGPAPKKRPMISG